MTRHIIVASVLLCVLGPVASAQQAPTPAATGVIAGALSSADLGQPVRKAQVRLQSATPRMTRTTTSDADGRYEFSSLPPGEYTLVASKPGFLDVVYGARRPGPTSPGVPILLVAGQKLTNVSLRLPRGSVITGLVIDEFGDPAFNTPVRAMRYIFEYGRRSLTSGGNGVTDDRGVYRIAGLMPGEYLVSAVPRDTVAQAAASAEALRDRQAQIIAAAKKTGADPTVLVAPPPASPTGYVPIYYPGTPSGATATTVRVGPSEEVGGIDIRLQVVQTASVAGAISSAEGGLPTTRLQLIDASMPMSLVGIWFRDARPDGSFAFLGVVPGPYIVKAHGTPGGQPGMAGGEMWASVDVAVDARGAGSVAVRLQGGVTVSGSLALDNVPPPMNLERVRVALLPVPSATDWEMAPFNMTPDAGGKFTARNVLPGQYRVVVSGLPDGWALASAVFDGKDAADYHLQIDGSRDYAGGDLKVTSRAGELAGAITTASGAPARDYTVILFPSDRGQWLPQSRRIHVVLAGPDGRYALRGLPPGEYRLAAVLDPEPGRQFDPEFLTELLSASIAMKLSEGDKRTHDLRVR